jgi:hypothetical protein
LTSFAGCNSLTLKTAFDYQNHYIALNKDGVAIAPPSSAEVLTNPSASLNFNEDRLLITDESFEKKLEQTIKNGINTYVNSKSACDGRLHLLIIVHGGMNGTDSAQHITGLMTPPIAPPKNMVGEYPKGGLLNKTCYYPLFINWDSDFLDSISDDLFRFRFRRHDPPLALSTAPFIISGRVLSSAMYVPTSLFHQSVTIKDGIIGAEEEGDDWVAITGDTLLNLPTYFLSMILLPFTEGFGAPAWSLMKQRADEATGSVAPTLQTRPQGAGRSLIQTLRKWLVVKKDCVDQEPAKDGVGKVCWLDTPTEVTVTMAGHSMGAMVINRLLQVSDDPSFPADHPSLPIDRIIYMAPACSINEAEQLLMGYLTRHPSTNFWLFMLNKRDESREIPVNGWAVIVPRGTLLAWIDTFLENEAGPGEGRLGWIKNLELYYGLKNNNENPPSRTLLEYFASAPQPWRKLEIEWSLRSDPRRLHAYSSQRRVSNHEAPEVHEDFFKPDHFKTILCTVDSTRFKSTESCEPSKQ